jgi:hypothetical protein
VRLGAYLFRRILRIKVDHRFDGMRKEPLRFARLWLLQAITVAVVMLPVCYLLDRDHPPAIQERIRRLRALDGDTGLRIAA